MALDEKTEPTENQLKPIIERFKRLLVPEGITDNEEYDFLARQYFGVYQTTIIEEDITLLSKLYLQGYNKARGNFQQ